MSIGEKIQSLRINQQMTQDTLAKTLKINRNFLSRIETGKSEPTSTILKNISNIFNVSVDSLLDINNLHATQKDKIKYITDNCKCLQDEDLEFLTRIISVMKEECVKKKYNRRIKGDNK